jgi:ABC-type cobalamin/Fe3+-siderophores transport system ATPase subunit
MSLLKVKNLSVHAGSKQLVSDLSFTLEKGERLGLIGESGSGKSLSSLAIFQTASSPPALSNSLASRSSARPTASSIACVAPPPPSSSRNRSPRSTLSCVSASRLPNLWRVAPAAMASRSIHTQCLSTLTVC